ncbi:hypothetical protein [Paracoccus sp. DMF]|uniref:hypothetical protein n=1 Tax=Paracoccus sp. DMF TaxID=400837 RepID=UPI001101F8B6|nr:hypothetical protein [Paracoccus sp. DMF]MCV2449208.1 hypothetical protein [Paracoccus sp. DMF]
MTIGSMNGTKRKQGTQVAFPVQEKAVISRRNRRLAHGPFVHIEDVSGSNPLSPTMFPKALRQVLQPLSAISYLSRNLVTISEDVGGHHAVTGIRTTVSPVAFSGKARGSEHSRRGKTAMGDCAARRSVIRYCFQVMEIFT